MKNSILSAAVLAALASSAGAAMTAMPGIPDKFDETLVYNGTGNQGFQGATWEKGVAMVASGPSISGAGESAVFLSPSYGGAGLTAVTNKATIWVLGGQIGETTYHKYALGMGASRAGDTATNEGTLYVKGNNGWNAESTSGMGVDAVLPDSVSDAKAPAIINKGLIEVNQTAKVATPKLHEKEIVRLEGDEISSILDTAEDGSGLSKHAEGYHKKTRIRDCAILTLFLGTGIRISELVGLNNENIDFTNNSFVVTRKGGNKAILYFSEEVGDALGAYLAQKENDPRVPPEEHALFLSLQYRRITVRAVENLVKKYAKIVSPLKKITPHKLRSTYGTALYRETGDIYIVADVLGHRDVNTTRKHYAAITEDRRRSAADAVKLHKKEDD